VQNLAVSGICDPQLLQNTSLESSGSAILAFLPARFRVFSIAIVFALALAFFINRGPYRAIRYSTTGDFATVYGAARCWIRGINPYEREPLKQQLAESGAPASVQRDQDVNPSVYLPSALVWMAPVAMLAWYPANALWCLLAIALWTLALLRILALLPLSVTAKWLIAAAALVFSPTYVGIYDGNPGVAITSLVILAVLDESWLRSAILLGIALCFKPQIAFCGFCIFLLRRKWRALAIAAVLFGAFLLAGSLAHWNWWQTERRNVALSFVPGGQSDPAPASHVAWQFLNAQTLVSYFVRERNAVNLVVWILAALLGVLFLWRARGSRAQTAAFLAVLTLLLTYHRYYDAQLLLLAIPFLVELWQRRGRFVLAAVCFLVLAFPIQSVFARRLGPEALTPSLKQAFLLRNQPAAVLLLCFLFALPLQRKQEL
jgi:hypothetical protein